MLCTETTYQDGSLTKESTAGQAHIANMFLKELSNYHIDILVLLLPPRAQETEVLSCVSPDLAHSLTETINSHRKISWGVQQLDMNWQVEFVYGREGEYVPDWHQGGRTWTSDRN